MAALAASWAHRTTHAGALRRDVRRKNGRAARAVVAAAKVDFYKYQGLGNDFVLVDNRDSPDIKISAARCAEICDRNFGVGADGVIFAMPPGE